MVIKQYRDSWKSAKLSEFDQQEVARADIVLVFGDGGFGVNVLKNRYGSIGAAFPDLHWTEVVRKLRRGNSKILA